MNRVKIVGVVTLMLFFMTGIWLIDLGSSTLAIQKVVDVQLVAKSLTITGTPNQVYHIGLIMCGICFYLLSILFIFEVLKKDANYTEGEINHEIENCGKRLGE